MSKFTLQIEMDLDNAAFAESGGSEVGRILHRLAERLDGMLEGHSVYALFDVNGNRVGEARLEYDDDNDDSSE